MDEASGVMGGQHRAVGHDLRTMDAVELLYGRQGRIIAAMHLMQDSGFFPGLKAPRKPRRRRSESGDSLTLF